MVTKEQLIAEARTGDLIFFRYNTFIGTCVRFFMKLGSKVNHAPFNHVGIVIEDDGYKWVYESSGGYIRRVKLEDRDLSKVALYRFSGSLSVNDINLIKRVATKYQGSSKYDYISLLWFQLVFQLTGKWKGSTGVEAEDKLYCSEYNALIYYVVKDIFPKWWLTDPEDMYNSMWFKLIMTNIA